MKILLLVVSILFCAESHRIKRQSISFRPAEANPNPVQEPPPPAQPVRESPPPPPAGPSQDAPSDCTSPDGFPGTCTLLFSCRPLYSQFRTNPTNEFVRFLRSSICRFRGSTPIVCCTKEGSPTDVSTTTVKDTGGLLVLGTTPATTTSTTTPSTTTASTTTTSTTTASTTPSTTSTTTSTATDAVTDIQTEPTIVEPVTDGMEDVITDTPVNVLLANLPQFDLLPTECGVPNLTSTTTRIVGGRIAVQGAWPWLAALGYKDRTETSFLCGGALITNQHILTAAHCVDKRSDLEVVRLGEHDLNQETEAAHEDYTIESRIVHPNYDSANFENDISILKLSRPVTYTRNILPGCLPINDELQNRDLSGRSAFVAGWGSIQYNNISSPILKEATVPIRTNDECQESYKIFNSIVIDERRLCAGTGGDDACQGDSGGPLMVYNFEDERYYVIGVVSVGFRCAEADFPGIYIRTAAYTDWITENLI